MIKELKYSINHAQNAGSEERRTAFPVVLSASRRTDIPAFHAYWFLDQLKRGEFLLRNPFHKKAETLFVKKVGAVVFWTKNAAPMLPLLPELSPYPYYFQYTLNDYEEEGLEPKIPPLAERISTFQELSEKIGKQRVIWRFDPLILSDRLTIERLLEKIKRIGDQLHLFTEKLVFSFADISIYPKVSQRMKKAGFNYMEFTSSLMSEMAKGIAELNRAWGLKLATCAEKIDLAQFGIDRNRCIDGELLRRLASEAEGSPVTTSLLHAYNRDKGQRTYCQCFPSTDIGQYNTCHHSCLYCYARP